MFGLVIKDFFVMRKNITYYFGFLVVYGILAAMEIMPYSVLAGIVAMFGLMLPMSSFAFDDQSRWEKFAAATPAGRKGVVQGKYLFALLCTASAAVLVGVILTALAFLEIVEAEVWWEPLAVVGACACVTLLLNSICLPFLLKYGSEKARMMSLLIFAAVFGGMALLSFGVERGFKLPPVPPVVITLLPVLLVAVTVAGLTLSYLVALGIYRKKEF